MLRQGHVLTRSLALLSHRKAREKVYVNTDTLSKKAMKMNVTLDEEVEVAPHGMVEVTPPVRPPEVSPDLGGPSFDSEFLQDLQRRAKELGLTPEEVLERDDHRSAMTPHVMGENCFDACEVRDYVRSALPQTRLRHLDSCPDCAALVAMARPDPASVSLMGELLCDPVRVASSVSKLDHALAQPEGRVHSRGLLLGVSAGAAIGFGAALVWNTFRPKNTGRPD